jgi:hypothetical protein
MIAIKAAKARRTRFDLPEHEHDHEHEESA